MTYNSILISKDGKLLAMNKPEKPRSECSGKGFNCCAGERCVLLVYSEVTMPFAIALAEKEGIEFKDQESVTELIWDRFDKSWDNKDLPIMFGMSLLRAIH